jgi:CRISPR/Cas system-associated exonuclease Cas4 (RecB family)
MPTIRASDIGNYLYCRRAWWYRKQGVESENQPEMDSGAEIHRQHGRRVLVSGMTRMLAMILLAAGFFILLAYCTAKIL